MIPKLTFTHPQVQISKQCFTSPDGGYYWQKAWGQTTDYYTYGAFSNPCYGTPYYDFKGCYKTVQYWYQEEGGNKTNTKLYTNNGTGGNITTSPFVPQVLINANYPITVGADIQFYDSLAIGSNSTAVKCCGYNTHGVSNLPTSVTVSANVTSANTTSVSLPLDMTVTADAAPSTELTVPDKAHISIALDGSYDPLVWNPSPGWIAWRDSIITLFANGFDLPITRSSYGCFDDVGIRKTTVYINDSDTNSNSTTPITIGSGFFENSTSGSLTAGYYGLQGGKNGPSMTDHWDYGFLQTSGGNAWVQSRGNAGARVNFAVPSECNFGKTINLSGSGAPINGGDWVGYLQIGSIYPSINFFPGSALMSFRVLSITRS